MAGLKGLKKKTDELTEEQANLFISGAQARVDNLSPEKQDQPKEKAAKKPATKKILLNVSEDMDKKIIQLSKVPQDISVPKSAVLRAGILALSQLDDDQLSEFLAQAIEV
jgi:hypothetical protein